MTDARSSTDRAPSIRYLVRLYIAGTSPNSLAAVANLRQVLARFPNHSVEVETIDVMREPGRGLQDGVLVTPMLVKIEPPPERRILGSLNNHAMLMTALGLDGQAT